LLLISRCKQWGMNPFANNQFNIIISVNNETNKINILKFPYN